MLFVEEGRCDEHAQVDVAAAGDEAALDRRAVRDK